MPKVRDIMTADVKTAEPDTTLEEIAKLMKDEDVGSVPIVEDGQLLGIVTDRDIVVRCLAQGQDPTAATAEQVLSEDLETCEPDADVRQAANIMARRQIRRLPVAEDGRLLGMVSLGDIAVKHEDERVCGEALEDISEGVKPSRAAHAGKKQPVSIDEARRQGISHQGRPQESRRQQRVNPARARSGSRRKAG